MIDVIDGLLGSVEAEVAALTRFDAVPVDVDDIASSIRALAASFGGASTAIEVRVADDPAMADAGARRALVRIAAEALHNAARHARASRIGIEVAAEADAVVLRVVDDGRGFDAVGGLDVGGVREGTGLSSMREWADDVGAALAVERAPGGGTRVVARFARRHPVS